MSVILALFLGLVQGLTEFLPVSSSGHLMLFQHLFSLPENMLLFNIILHLATLGAVVVVFRRRIWQLVRHPFNKTNLCLLITTAITCLFVVLFNDFVEKTMTYKVLPFTFMVTAVLLFVTTICAKKGARPEKHITFKSAVATGLAQSVAIMPGISRSGSTIAVALLTGTERARAAEFSFLMSIPVIVASFVYEIIKSGGEVQFQFAPTAVAFIAAFLSGIFAIRVMLAVVARVKLHWFGVYLVVLSVVCLFLVF